jgi:hypothetical protein
MNEEKINKAFDEQYKIWKSDASQQLKTAEDEEFEMLERQLSGWRKRQIETQKEGIDKYDPCKVFLQAGWYSEEQLTNLVNKLKDKK